MVFSNHKSSARTRSVLTGFLAGAMTMAIATVLVGGLIIQAKCITSDSPVSTQVK